MLSLKAFEHILFNVKMIKKNILKCDKKTY